MSVNNPHFAENTSVKRRRFFYHAILLSCVNIIMRGIAVGFNAYINNKIGAEGMGLYTLIMSVYGFAVTLSLSCVNLGAMKLTSERCVQLSEADKSSWKSSMYSLVGKLCLYAMLFGFLSAILMLITAHPISIYILDDRRCEASLKLLAFSLPAISLSSALAGFFTGLRKVYKNAISAVSEQFAKIILISTGLYLSTGGDTEKMCLALICGSVLTELWSAALNLIMYIFDSKSPSKEKYGNKKKEIKTKFKAITDISFIAAIGTYARQGLTTLEHIAIPSGLKKSGLSEKAALASYGLLQGIAFPLVMFPYAVIGSFTSLLIPEIAEKNELGDSDGIKRLTLEVYRYSALFSIGACAIFVIYGKTLGELIYSSTEAATYTVVLGLLVPFMYLDTAVDSLLKGMGEQVYNMKVNIGDSASGLILVWLLTPHLGIWGYIITVWLCEVGNLIASISKLSAITGVSMLDTLKQYKNPIIYAVLCAFVKITFLDRTVSNKALSVMLFVCLYITVVFLSNRKRVFRQQKSLV